MVTLFDGLRSIGYNGDGKELKEGDTITTKQKIEAACKIAGISVTELGLKMGMSQQSISKRLKTGKFTQEEYEEMADIM